MSRINPLKLLVASCAVAATTILLSGCTQLAAVAISSNPEVDISRISKAQSYGYIARFEELKNPGQGDFSKIKELSLVRTRDAITIRAVVEHNSTSKSYFRIFEVPGSNLYLVEIELFNADNGLVGSLAYSFSNAKDLYGSIAIFNDMPVNKLVDYLVSFRADECREVNYVAFNDIEFVEKCHINEGTYKVEKWVSFDDGLYFPKVFSFTNGWGNKITLSTIMAREISKAKLEKITTKLNQTVIPEFAEKIKANLIEKVINPHDARTKINALVNQEVLPGMEINPNIEIEDMSEEMTKGQ